VYCFEKPGVLNDATDDLSVIPKLNSTSYADLKSENKVFAGMLPKLDNAFSALQSGVHKVIIGHARDLHLLLDGKAGTTISNE
jgi:acetylglutamate kinase